MPTPQKKRKSLDEIFGDSSQSSDSASGQDSSGRKSLDEIFSNSDNSSDQNNYQSTGNPILDRISDQKTDPAKRQATYEATVAEAQRQKGLLDKFISGVGSIGKSIVKPFAEVGTSIYNTGSGIGKLAKGDVQGAAQELKKSRNIPLIGETKPAVTGDETLTESLKKQVGYGAQIASTIAPVGKVGVGAKALVKGALKFGAAGALGEAGRELSDNEKLSATKISTSAAISGAIPAVGRLASKGLKGAGVIASEVLGKTTNTSADVIKEAFNNPNVMKFARSSKGNPVGLQEQALEEAQKGLKNIVERRGSQYVSKLEKIKSSGQDIQSVLSNTRDHASELLDNFDIKAGGEGKKLNNLDFSGSTITKNTEVAQKAFNDVMGWTDTTAAGLDKLQKRLGQYASDIPATERGGAHRFVTELQGKVKDGLKEKVPGYREMTQGYAQASELIDDIQKALSLKDTASKDTAIKKLMSTVRDNQDFRKEFVDVLSGASGSDISGKLAGAALSPWAVKGLGGKVALGGAGAIGAASFIHPSTVGLLISYVAASSPRLVGELTSLLGGVTKQAIKANKFTPEIQNGIRLILQQTLNKKNRENAQEENTESRPSLEEIFN